MKPARKPVLFREPQAVLPNSLALAYALGGYVLAFVLLARPCSSFAERLSCALTGVLLGAHSMFIAAYLLHEALHRTTRRSCAASRAGCNPQCWRWSGSTYPRWSY